MDRMPQSEILAYGRFLPVRNLLNMCDTIRIGVEDFLWSGDHPIFGQSYPPELIR